MNNRNSFPLTLPQFDLYIHQMLYPQSPLYNVGSYIKCGAIEVDRMKRVHAKLVSSHSVFSLRMTNVGNDVKQYVSPTTNTQLELVDFSDVAEPEKAANNWIKKNNEIPFDLEETELYRAYLLKVGEQSYWYYFVCHHLILDGLSVVIFCKKLALYYKSPEFVESEPFDWTEITQQDIEYKTSDKYTKDKEYWTQYCADRSERLHQPIYRKHFSDLTNIPSCRQTLQLERSLVNRLDELARDMNVGLSQVFLGIIGLYFLIAHKKRHLLFGVATMNRKNFAQKQMIGSFSNVNPLLLEIDEQLTVREFIANIARLQKSCYRFQRYPSGDLIREIGGAHADTPFYDGTFNYGIQKQECEFVGLESEIINLPHNHEQSPISFVIWDKNSELLDVHIDYNLGYYKDDEIALLINRLESLYRNFANNCSKTIGELNILPNSESQFLQQRLSAQVPQYKGATQLHNLFENAAQRFPKCIAVQMAKRQLTYAQLDAAANSLANQLIARGVQQQSLVGICLERSVEMMIAILAILKAGCAYVPLDPTFPKARLRGILQDAALYFVITQAELVNLVQSEEGNFQNSEEPFSTDKKLQLVVLDSKEPISQSLEQPVLRENQQPIDLAYLIYTSGSTGKPKGVMVEHGKITEHIDAVINKYDFSVEDNVLQVANYGFDTFIEQTFAALASGATVIMAPNHLLDAYAFFQLVQQHSITITDLTPAHFHQLLSPTMAQHWQNASISRVVIGGEALDSQIIHDWYQYGNPINCKLFNAYGPTEAVITSAVREIKPEDKTQVRIGEVFGNRQLRILNQDLTATPVGFVGELYIGGPLLSCGYLNHEELNQSRFVIGADDARQYRTGDLVRLLPDGELEFIGRVDDQVKVNGFRIELQEIESQLMATQQLNSCIVIAKRDKSQQLRLFAYGVAKNNCHKADLSQSLLQHLNLQLPNYMVPRDIILLDQWPLSASGKVDKSALPEPELLRQRDTRLQQINTPLQARLSQLICEVVGVDNVGLHDNFFDIGVNSILLLKIQRAINDDGQFQVKTTDLFTHSSVAKLAKFLGSDNNENRDSKRAEKSSEEVPKADNQSNDRDIAIIALACRFPDADGIEQFWDNLICGKESIEHFGRETLLNAGVSEQNLAHDAFVSSGIVLDDIEHFDAELFKFSPREAETLDPQQRLLFECAHDALEQSGYGSKTEAQNIGVFVGVGNSRYLADNLTPNSRLRDRIGELAIELGTSKDYVATKLAYKFNLSGPAVNINTACSTSLVSVHQACMSLLDGSSEVALAGGASIGLLKAEGYIAEEGGIASLDGHCRTFDQNASGTRRGSGAGVVLLKPLNKAVTDGDCIHAVIKGSAINNDGADKVGYTAPGVQGQSQVVAAALRAADVSPASLGYLETHGTGTVLGDPIEVAALKTAFGDTLHKQYCALGTLKPNIGHLDSAAGIASLIKTTQVLKNRQLPPSINFQQANEQLDLENSPFYVNTTARTWSEQSFPRRAGISSFGIGGTNAHVILEEYLSTPAPEAVDSTQLIILSANSEASLVGYKKKLARFLRQSYRHRQNQNQDLDIHIRDIAYSLARRTEYQHRCCHICNSTEQLVRVLENDTQAHSSQFVVAGNTSVKPVFLFPGQGSQYRAMGKGLYESQPLFRSTLQECAAILEPLLGLDICTLLYQGQDEEIKQTRITQALLFSFEYALAKLWLSWGIKPSVMLGHSLGEYVAACISGVFSLEDALKIVAYRGELMQKQAPGAMLSVSLSKTEFLEFLDSHNESFGNVCLAAVNGRENSVASGSFEAIAALRTELNRQGIHCVALDTSHAFHSSMMTGVLKDFADFMASIAVSAPRLPFISNFTGQLITPEQAMAPDYWCQHLIGTVQFSRGIDALVQMGESVFLEIGPGNTLINLVKRHQPASNLSLLASVKNKKNYTDDEAFLLSCLGSLWQRGVSVDWSGGFNVKNLNKNSPKADSFQQKNNAPSAPRMTWLPGYHYDRKRYWIDAAAPVSELVDNAQKTSADWLYQLSWKAQPQVKNSLVSLETQTAIQVENKCENSASIRFALVLMDQDEVTNALCESLQYQGYERIIRVYRGGTYKQHDDWQFTLEPNVYSGYASLFNVLQHNDISPELIVHGWNLDEVAEESWKLHEDIFNSGLYSVMHLLQALEQVYFHKPMALKILTSYGQLFDADDVIYPEKVCLSALPAVISQEYPHISCQCIDVELVPSRYLAKQVRTLTREIISDSADEVVCLRGNQRWHQTIEPMTALTEPSLLKGNGVYVISGGLSGIGLALAEYLAEQYQAKIALIARTDFPSPSTWSQWQAQNPKNSDVSKTIVRLQRIQSLGSELMICRADIASRTCVDRVLAQINQRFGQLNGFIHSAGVAGSGVISHKTTGDIQRVLQPKVQGSMVLTQALKKYRPDLVVFCSSLSSMLGGLGQYEYSAANAFQDALAHRETSQTTRYIAINWDSWGESGMLKDSIEQGLLPDSAKEYLSDAISNNEGKLAFGRVLSQLHTQVLVSKVNPARQKYLPGLQAPQSSSSEAQHQRPELATAYVAPVTDIEIALADIWSDLMGFTLIGVDDDFYALGGDSLILGRLVSKINQQWLISYPIKAAFEHTNISAMAAGIEQYLAPQQPELLGDMEYEEELL